jgi:excisionase family DNA binding protein
MNTQHTLTPEGSALFTPKQTSTYLHLSATTLRKLARQGVLRPGRVGRVLRYRRGDVEAYVRALTTAST